MLLMRAELKRNRAAEARLPRFNICLRTAMKIEHEGEISFESKPGRRHYLGVFMSAL